MKDRHLIAVILILFAILLVGGTLKAFGQSGFRPDDIKVDTVGDGSGVWNGRRIIFQEGANISLYRDGDTVMIVGPAPGTGAAVWDSLWKHLDTIGILARSAVLYDWLDSTAAKIPTATDADSTIGGAARATTSATADSAKATTHQSIERWDMDSTSMPFVFSKAYHGTWAQWDSALVTTRYVKDSVAGAGDNLGNHTATQNINLAGFNVDGDTGIVFILGEGAGDGTDFEIVRYNVTGDTGVACQFYNDSFKWLVKPKFFGMDIDMDSVRFVPNNLAISGHSGMIILNAASAIHGNDWVGIKAQGGQGGNWVMVVPSWDGTTGMALIDSSGDGATTWGYPDSANGGAIRSETAKYADSARAVKLGSYAAPTTDAEGELAWDSGDDMLEVYDGAASRAIPTVHSREATIVDPDNLLVDTVLIMDVDATAYPGGIKIVEFAVATYANSTYSVRFLEMTDPATQTADCDTVATSGSMEASSSGSGIYDADIAAGNWVGIVLPATDIDQLHVRVSYYVKEN